MIHERVGRLRLELYNGIDELPSERYHKFNLYCLMYTGIGNDAESVAKHIGDMYQSLTKNDTERLKIQLQNYHHSLYLILEKADIQSMAFACLVHSINGKEVTDLSEEGLKWIQGRISRASKRQQITKLLKDLKKKIEDEIELYFPERVNNNRVSMHYNYINKHGKLLNRKILGENVEDEIERVENEFYMRNKPVVYGGEKGLLLKTEKDFETNCAILQQKGTNNPKKITISEFYSAIHLIEKQANHGRPKRNKKHK